VAEDIVKLTERIMKLERFCASSLFRIYYYDAPPLQETVRNPLDGRPYSFGAQVVYKQNRRLQSALAVAPDVVLRRGEVLSRGWRLRESALAELARNPRPLSPEDLRPHVEQKGVDLRIGLDVATLCAKRVVGSVVLATGDSDLVPAMKFARREGLKAYLAPLGHGVRAVLREHVDAVLHLPVEPDAGGR
jgi:uncharacterized LabA/DUF88 family protein